MSKHFFIFPIDNYKSGLHTHGVCLAYTLYITDDCTNVERARQICQGYGGKTMVK